MNYSISDFVSYLGAGPAKSMDIHIARYDETSEIRLQSNPITIDFFILAIKQGCKNAIGFGKTEFDNDDYYLYFNKPDSTLQWDLDQSFIGYNIFINRNFFYEYSKKYNFVNYNNHEALFVTEEEKTLLLYLFENAYLEYNKTEFKKDIIMSYASLIFSYIHTFYERQFETRGNIYNKVVANFYEQLEQYFDNKPIISDLPSVKYFADKAHLSPNYFGDVISYFTGNSAQNHIQQHIIQTAKQKLRQSSQSVSEIAYSLGFKYPTYFIRFFKKNTGITPATFRNQ
jgi:AraC-like DNA-binding protein